MDSLNTVRLSTSLRLDGARILRPDGRLETGSLAVANGTLSDDAHAARTFSLDGLLVLLTCPSF
jgi:hypothetical protein